MEDIDDLILDMISNSTDGLTVIQMSKICKNSINEIQRVSHELMCQCKIRNPDQYGRYRPLIKDKS